MKSFTEEIYDLLDFHFKVIVSNNCDTHKKLICFRTKKLTAVDGNYVYSTILVGLRRELSNEEDHILLDTISDWVNQCIGFEVRLIDWV